MVRRYITVCGRKLHVDFWICNVKHYNFIIFSFGGRSGLRDIQSAISVKESAVRVEKKGNSRVYLFVSLHCSGVCFYKRRIRGYPDRIYIGTAVNDNFLHINRSGAFRRADFASVDESKNGKKLP
jgi:hypothetical protein